MSHLNAKSTVIQETKNTKSVEIHDWSNLFYLLWTKKGLMRSQGVVWGKVYLMLQGAFCVSPCWLVE